MTHAQHAPRNPHSPASRGFTLVELLIVISVMLILMGLLVVGVGAILTKAKVRSTEALIERLQLSTDDFQTQVGYLPHDGMDDTFRTPDGTDVQSSAALYNQLTQKITKAKRDPSGAVIDYIEITPVLDDLGQDSLSAPNPPDDEHARDIVDAWGNAIHYDNVRGGFSPQDSAQVHRHSGEAHEPDVRNSDAVAATGAQNKDGYDIWSHGPNGHTAEFDYRETIANFNLSDE